MQRFRLRVIELGEGVPVLSVLLDTLRLLSCLFFKGGLWAACLFSPIASQGQSPDPEVNGLIRFHDFETNRARLWVKYYESLASASAVPNEYALLAEEWRSYAAIEQQWTSYFNHAPGAYAGRSCLIAKSTGGHAGNSGDIAKALPAVVLQSGMAFGLSGLPAAVHKMLQAGNFLQSKPYIRGGGHRLLEDRGYDCSSAISYVLVKGGFLDQVLNTQCLASYGQPGVGRFVTIWVKPGTHAFMTICGLRFDTAGGGLAEGPRWRTTTRSYAGFIARHPPGL